MSIYGNPVMLGGSGGGGGDVPLLTRAQWSALTLDQKRAYGLVAIQDTNSGYDRGELYYGADASADVPLIPAMTDYTTPSGIASSSSFFNTGFESWRAFNGIQGNPSSLNGCWLASSSDTTPYLAYEFDSSSSCYTIWLELMNNSTAITVTAYIEGLTNGTWENCLESGSSVSLTFGGTQTYTFNLNGNNYDAIRIRGIETWYKGAMQAACGFSRVQVYTV